MRVVILGSLGLAVEFLEWLLSRQGVDMVGAVCSRQPMKPWRTLTGDRDMQSVAPAWACGSFNSTIWLLYARTWVLP